MSSSTSRTLPTGDPPAARWLSPPAPRGRGERRHRTDLVVDRLRAQRAVLGPGERADLLNELVVLNTPVAQAVARRFEGRGCALDDLEQTAFLALVRASRAYDVDAGHPFLAYAVPCITGEVKRYFRDLGWMVRPPRTVQELQPRVAAERLRPDEHTGRPPDDREVAERLAVSEHDVRASTAARGCFSPTSLQRPVDGSPDLELGHSLPDPGPDGFAAAEARVVLAPALAGLDEDQRRLVTLTYGEGRTQREVAELLGTSQPQVSRWLAAILAQMRHHVGPLVDAGRG